MTKRKLCVFLCVAGIVLCVLSCALAYHMFDLNLRSTLASVRGKPYLRASAIDSLGGKQKAARRLIRHIGNPSQIGKSQETAIVLLGMCDQYGIGHLKKLTVNPAWKTRAASALALGSSRTDAHERARLLKLLLNDRNKEVRRRAAGAFALLGSDGRGAGEALINTLNDRDNTVRGAAAVALGQIHSGNLKCPVAVTDSLLAALQDEYSSVRASAAGSLGEIGRADARIVTHLFRASGSSSDLVRVQVAKALLRLGATSGWSTYRLTGTLLVKGLREELSGKAPHGKLPACGPEVGRLILRAAQDQEYVMRLLAALEVAHAKARTVDKLAVLRQLGDDDHADIRWAAAVSAGRLGHAGKNLIPMLQLRLKDEDPYVRQAAAEALKKIRGEVEKSGSDK